MTMIALKVPIEIADKLSKISVPGKKSLVEEMHITMFYFPDELSFDEIIKVTKILHSYSSKIDFITIKVDQVTSFPKGEDGIPIIMPIKSNGLLEVRKQMAKKLDNENLAFSKKWPEYKPHLTLAYSKEEMKDKKIDPIKWKATELSFWAGEDMVNSLYISIPLGLDKKSSNLFLLSSVADYFQILTKSS